MMVTWHPHHVSLRFQIYNHGALRLYFNIYFTEKLESHSFWLIFTCNKFRLDKQNSIPLFAMEMDTLELYTYL